MSISRACSQSQIGEEVAIVRGVMSDVFLLAPESTMTTIENKLMAFFKGHEVQLSTNEIKSKLREACVSERAIEQYFESSGTVENEARIDGLIWQLYGLPINHPLNLRNTLELLCYDTVFHWTANLRSLATHVFDKLDDRRTIQTTIDMERISVDTLGVLTQLGIAFPSQDSEVFTTLCVPRQYLEGTHKAEYIRRVDNLIENCAFTQMVVEIFHAAYRRARFLHHAIRPYTRNRLIEDSQVIRAKLSTLKDNLICRATLDHFDNESSPALLTRAYPLGKLRCKADEHDFTEILAIQSTLAQNGLFQLVDLKEYLRLTNDDINTLADKAKYALANLENLDFSDQKQVWFTPGFAIR
ncbi:hypothetical protein [Vibrio mediterranei]|uniref:hypothetical protein n=1 Tax=Vibrio mediterranei TaxID=689 RepID=UPI00406863F8